MLTVIRPNQVFDLAAAMELARTTMAGAPRWQAELSDWTGGDRPFGTGVPDAALVSYTTWPGATGHDLLSRPGRALISETHHRAATFAVLHGPAANAWTGSVPARRCPPDGSPQPGSTCRCCRSAP